MKKIKVIMLDAFKPEYLNYAPYLRGLAEKYQHGSLEVPPGFWGAMDTFFNGKTDKLAFFYYTENSSIRWIKPFTIFGRFVTNVFINLYRLFRGEVLFSVKQIPLKKVHLYDTDVKQPYSKGKNVEYTHILTTDSVGHKYGPKSWQIRKAVKEIDDWLKKQDFDIILSDHGMMKVKEFVRIPETEKCFIDSTLARYWGKVPEKKDLPMSKVRIIKGHKKYGDLILEAKPGVVFLPNYWQGSAPIKGMHGYNPKTCREMDGFYLVKKNGKRKNLTMNLLHQYIHRLQE